VVIASVARPVGCQARRPYACPFRVNYTLDQLKALKQGDGPGKQKRVK